MKHTGQHFLLTLAFAGLMTAAHATAVVVDFTTAEGYTDGDLTDNDAWNGDAACTYQLQTNSTIDGVWGAYGSPVSGTETVSIPISERQLYIRAEVQ